MYRLNEAQQRIVTNAAAVAGHDLAARAADVDREGAFPKGSIKALGASGLMGLNVPVEHGGLGQGPRTAAAVIEALAQSCPSTAMVYMMHLCGIACYSAAADKTAQLLAAAAKGQHLSTLAFSEKGSRSHFWAPVSRAATSKNGAVTISAQKSFVTSAGHADGYVVSTLAAAATQPIESSIYLVLKDDKGLAVSGTWQGLGLRGNSSAAMTLDRVLVGADRALTADGKGLDMMLGVVLPLFQMGSAAVGIGIAEAAVQATIRHVTQARFEESNSSLADLPTLRAQIARMRIETDRARAHLCAVLDSLESPGPATQLLVLEAKASGTETAATVTEMAMRTCGGAAFGGAHGIERMFRDARAPIVMAPTSDVAYEFIGRALCGMEVFGVMRALKVGAVMYDPKVSVIWEIIRDFFDAQGAPIDVAFYSTYEAQNDGLLSGAIEIAWNSPLAWVDAQRRSGNRCRAIAMRDTDRDRISYFVARRVGPVQTLDDLKGRTLATGATDSPQATLIPLGRLRRQGLSPGVDVTVRRFDVLVGKHGDHVGGERDALSCLMKGEADVCAMLDLNWEGWIKDGTIDDNEFAIVGETDRFDHCVFTVRHDLDAAAERRWLDALFAMRYDNPAHREMMDLEGLKAWLPGRTTGFGPLTSAVETERFFASASA